MVSDQQATHLQHSRVQLWRRWWPRQQDSAPRQSNRNPGVLYLLLLLPCIVGCDGCRRAADDAADKGKPKTQQQPSEAMTFGSSVVLPSGESDAQTAVKLGHWFTLRQSLRSNLTDERGDLQFKLTGSVSNNERIESEALTFVRPAVLPKGRMKRLDIRMLAALPNNQSVSRVETNMVFSSANTRVDSGRVNHRILRGDEYQIVILTRRPERFDRFREANWVRSWMWTEDTSREITSTVHYQLVIPKFDGVLDLPETALDWTSVAYVFWDDFSPSKLTAVQLQALIDWMHFGGRLIVNGTSIVPELTASSLNAYLPLQFEGLVELEPESLAQLVNRYEVDDDNSSEMTLALINNLASRIRIGGGLRADAWSVPGTDELITVKPVGRGEVIMSGFDLTSEWTDGWRSYDSFMNQVILGRPARQFNKDQEDLYTQQFASPTVSRSDVNSQLRFFSRDALLNGTPSPSKPLSNAEGNSTISQTAVATPPAEARDTTVLEFQSQPLSGYAGWSDTSSVALWLQSKLKENAGVNIPDHNFVLKTLSVLIFLISVVNYGVFRALGRLEWAWFAIPIIAVLGAGYTARSMSVDFGLGRNQNDVSFLELQPNHSRGHLTRYLSIYNSLSGTYTASFESPDTCAAPVSNRIQAGMEPDPCRFEYSYTEGPTLSGFEVPSNRTRLMHVEQMVDVGGAIELRQDKLVNGSKLALSQCTLLRCNHDGTSQWASIDQLGVGSSVLLEWQSDAPENLPILLPPGRQSRGSIRLVAQYESTSDDLAVQPETHRNQSENWLLAHLQHPRTVHDQRDQNLPPKIRRRNTFESEVVAEPEADASPLAPDDDSIQEQPQS